LDVQSKEAILARAAMKTEQAEAMGAFCLPTAASLTLHTPRQTGLTALDHLGIQALGARAKSKPKDLVRATPACRVSSSSRANSDWAAANSLTFKLKCSFKDCSCFRARRCACSSACAAAT